MNGWEPAHLSPLLTYLSADDLPLHDNLPLSAIIFGSCRSHLALVSTASSDELLSIAVFHPSMNHITTAKAGGLPSDSQHAGNFLGLTYRAFSSFSFILLAAAAIHFRSFHLTTGRHSVSF